VAFRLPNNSQHSLVTGRNGTGKTRFAFWLFGLAPFDSQPYIVLDWKEEELFARCDRIREISLKDPIPTDPSVYIIRPLPGQEQEIEDWLWRVWSQGNTGLYVDEGYSINPRSPALQAILTQGRSRHLPVIYLAQRPSHISRFVISEATFLSIFAINDKEDRKRIQQFVPDDKIDLDKALPPFYSHWYDVGQNENYILRPVPSDDELLDVMDRRLTPKRKVT
jgi:hypothetical protein